MVLSIGTPIEIRSTPGSMRLTADHTVVSVGPYMFHSSPAPGKQFDGEIGCHRLPTAQQLQLIVTVPAGVDQHPPRRRGGLHDCRAETTDGGDQPGGIERRLTVDEHEMGTVDEGQEDLEHRDVERQRGHREEGVVAAQSRPLGHRGEEVDDVAVFDLDTLGPTGGARGVDDVGELVAGHRDVGPGSRLSSDRVRRKLSTATYVVATGGVAGRRSAVVIDHRGAGVGLHELEAVGGKTGIERKVGRACLEDGEQCDHHLRGAFEVQPDDVAGNDAEVDQMVGELVARVSSSA